MRRHLLLPPLPSPRAASFSFPPLLRCCFPRPPGNLTAGDSLYPPPPPPLLCFLRFCSGAVEISRSLSLARAATHMASSSDKQPKPPEPPAAAVAAAAQSHAEWAASLQAYYAAAGHPYAWPAQHLMAAAASGAPYGTPVPFPVYHPGAAMAYYAHASMAVGVTYPAAEAVAAVAAAAVKGKGKGGGASPEKGSSGAPSGDDASRSGDSGSEESSETRDDDTDHKDSCAPKKRKSGNTSAEGVPSQTVVVPCAAVESPYQVKGRSASKLPVSAPGRAALSNATPNLNIGIDLWSASPALDVPAGQGEANPGLALARRDGVAQLDERELKRERRKQSNRESARRSRLRKQCSSLLPCEVCYPCVAPVSFKWWYVKLCPPPTSSKSNKEKDHPNWVSSDFRWFTQQRLLLGYTTFSYHDVHGICSLSLLGPIFFLSPLKHNVAAIILLKAYGSILGVLQLTNKLENLIMVLT